MIRLTLRTLLAYLDEVSDLTVTQREELRQQIEASDFARELVQRLRDASHRVRLPAPSVLGTGAADDPNTVAEYLENALPPESVAEFERICLESDTMLAEVSACHHVLKQMLDDPAKVSPADRERIEDRVRRAIAAGPATAAGDGRLRIEPAHPETATAVANGTLAPAGVVREQPPAEVPDYLRPSWGDRLPLIVGAVAATVLGGLAVVFLTPAPEIAKQEGLSQPGIVDVPTPPQPAGNDDSSDPGEGEANLSGTQEQTDIDNATAITAPEPAPKEQPPQVDEAEDTPSASDVPDPISQPETNPQPENPPQSEPTPGPIVPPVELGQPKPVTDIAPVERDPVERDPVARAESSNKPEPLKKIGDFLGPETSVAVVRDKNGSWLRLTADAALVPGSVVECLPSYRARFKLANGVMLKLIDDTRVAFDQGREDARLPRVGVEYGRLVFDGNGEKSAVVELDVAGIIGRVELAPNARLAVEVLRPYTPGFDVLAASPTASISAWAPQSGVVWTTPLTTVRADRPRSWKFTASGDLDQLTDASTDPGWIEPVGQSISVERASRDLESLMPQQRPLRVELARIAINEDYLPEVRRLGAVAALSLGQVDEIVAMLDEDNSNEVVIGEIVTHLRDAASRSPELASAIRRALVDKHGERRADDVVSLLRGYSPQQVGLTQDEREVGAVDQLLTWLEDDTSTAPAAVLRLAALNLHELIEIDQSDRLDPYRETSKKLRTRAKNLKNRLGKGRLNFVGDDPDAP
ncbi:hypothetical protein [Botrimarina hoheduenensis]|uniref:Uncharacterized protein n=1 Tax=Botrimarina hoheduenensis TaxID=2528000 RepID=A0A5C5WA80_9BACT|nr:hypothetical protein [Botrimarina hoheduenensis]TWT46532.1 hypothetical protein Pla111_16280 [Botrimarina hoheduenensis]